MKLLPLQLKKNTKRRHEKYSEKGFSLVEIIVSVGIFIAIITGVVIFSVRTIEAHTKSKAMQNSLENARFAIESLSKKIRTSRDIVNGGAFSTKSNEVFIVDNVDFSKHCYQFSSGKLETAEVAESDADYSTINNCADFVSEGIAFSDLVGVDDKITATGGFYIKSTELDTADPKRGFVRIVVEIEYTKSASTPVSERDTAVVQSGVSLRDYEVIGRDN